VGLDPTFFGASFNETMKTERPNDMLRKGEPSMNRGKSLMVGITIIGCVLLGSIATARAQGQPPPPPPGYGPPPGYYPPPPPAAPHGLYRQGLVFGGALGGGTITASNCYACGGGIAGELHLGGMVNPRMAVMADVWGIAHPYDPGDGSSQTLSNYMLTGALQYWLTDMFWIKGGLGIATIRLSDATGADYGMSESSLGILAAGGFELIQSNTFALDLQLRLGHGTYASGGATNLAFLVGVNWY
jgi:hypothetical protein